MFEKPTVIITGAGASWHYGYPTGEDLVHKVTKKARIAAQFFRETANARNVNTLAIRPAFFQRYPVMEVGSVESYIAQWSAAANHCDELAARLAQVQPLVIDYFLGQNDSLRDIGKLMIAWVILECEAVTLNDRRNTNRQSSEPRNRDNWCRFIVHKLLNGCSDAHSLLANNITFITFNYDVSLDWNIANGLRHIEMFSGHVHEFFVTHPVLHIYGCVRDCPELDADPLPTNIFPINAQAAYNSLLDMTRKYGEAKVMFDMADKAAQQIRTIGPHDKDQNAEVIERARTAIRDAACVYILGYGFDENNSRRLDMRSLSSYSSKPRVVLLTNYNDSNRINKKASQLLFGNATRLLGIGQEIATDGGSFYVEKSTRDVYSALEQDFDSVEELSSYPLPR